MEPGDEVAELTHAARELGAAEVDVVAARIRVSDAREALMLASAFYEESVVKRDRKREAVFAASLNITLDC